MEPKIKFVVSGRLEAKAKFKQLEVRSVSNVISIAEKRAEEWRKGKLELVKAKPETIIESIEFPHMLDCFQCALPLFKEDIYYFHRGKSYCCKCAESLDGGLYDLVGNATVLDEKL